MGCAPPGGPPRFGFIVARDVEEDLASLIPNSVEARECPVRQDLPPVVYRPALGGESTVHTDPSSAVEILAAPVEVLLTRHPDSGAKGRADSDASPLVAARVRFEAAEQSKLVGFRERYESCRILVSIDGEPVWFSTNRSDWSGGILVGVFDTNSKSYATLVGDATAVRWVDWPELDAALAATQRSRESALQRLACDSDFGEEFERENPGAIELLREELDAVSCPEAAP